MCVVKKSEYDQEMMQSKTTTNPHHRELNTDHWQLHDNRDTAF